jgi:hypothetical protein
MNLVNELENDLALAFLVDKKYAEKIDSKDVVVLMDKIREVLQPLSIEEEDLNERVLVVGQVDSFLDH